MIDSLKKEWQAKVALIIFFLYTLWWLALLFLVPEKESIYHDAFTDSYAIVAFWGGLWGLFISQKWGFGKSLMGRAVLMLSLGLFLQLFGQLAYSFYAYYLKIEAPYPSIGDVGYFGSIFFYIYGTFLLAKLSGVKFKSLSSGKKVLTVLIPLVILLVSFFFFLKGYEADPAQPLTTILDFGYPLGEAVYISLAILTYFLSAKSLGGVMRNKVLFVLFALLVQYIADFTFLYRQYRGLWYAGGPNDYIYLVAYFIMTLALLELNTIYKKIKSE